jgi:hypothetical protein
MIGGLSYQVAHPPFVIPRLRPYPRARAPPKTVPIGPETGPEHAEGLAVAPASPGEPRPNTRQVRRTGVKV